MDSVHLYRGEQDGTHRLTFIKFKENGEFLLAGQDIGKAPKEFWGLDEYEYDCFIKPKDLHKLYEYFKVKNGDKSALLEAIKNQFNGWYANSDLRKLIKKLDIPFRHTTWHSNL